MAADSRRPRSDSRRFRADAVRATASSEELRRLGRIGYIRGIQAKLDEIGDETPERRAFVDHMRALIADVDLARYMAALDTLGRRRCLTRRKGATSSLVVDDSPETLGFLTDALEGAGFTVLVALQGTSALRLVEEITPDIILLDAVMPGMDGFETCRRLKQKNALAHVPVIFMTGLSETEHIVRGLEAGGVDYVTKPIVPDEMLARMQVHLANARLGHERAQCRSTSPGGS